jgi:hypothetical protein
MQVHSKKNCDSGNIGISLFLNSSPNPLEVGEATNPENVILNIPGKTDSCTKIRKSKKIGTRVDKLNNELTTRLEERYKKAFDELVLIQSKYPEINKAKELAIAFDLERFQKNAYDQLNNKLIKKWEKYQENVLADHFDMILFEYHEQSTKFMETVSYGIFNMKDYKLTLAPHYFGYDYSFENWEGAQHRLGRP